ncbi:MAG: hypothetical protein QOI03_1619, partial [Solirubrobacteraceae bacterium]|nr:hypothetical protein [Solirubrobacteraceae bacterium]
MKPLNNARQLAWRAMLSALAGGGLTAAGAGGSLSAALGATGTAPPSEVPASAQPEAPPATAPVPAPAQTTTTTPEAAPPPTSTTTFAPPPPPQTSKAKKPRSQPAPSGVPVQPPSVMLKRKQKTTAGKRATPSLGETSNATRAATGANNVAPPPQLLAGQAQAIAAALASSSASVQALGFYRVPLFLLPIYKAAAVQYGVPWQILAAINEIETNYGADQSVSTAGAVGWMQFMPATWLQYGVDALDAGYADPYNPVDAIFAAGRYLRAAGAATNLSAAILAYNHSEEYVASVLLRAKLISSYPKSVVATLTGLTDARLPVTDRHATWATLRSVPVSPSSATASAAAVPSHPAGAAATKPVQGSAPAPGALANGARSALAASLARPQQFAELTSAADAAVVAVQDGRVVEIGKSARLGRFIVLRDVYGDLFTYAGLGSIAPSYPRPKSPRAPITSPAVEAASTRDPAPSQPASAGRQVPLTLSVKTQAKDPAAAARARAHAAAAHGPQAPTRVGTGKVRLFAHPGNPDALAAAAS